MKKKNMITGILIGTILVAGLTYAGYELYQWWNDGRLIQQEADEIASDFLLPEEIPPVTEPPNETEEAPDEAEESVEPVLTIDYEKLLATNREAIGWIRIDGTNVNYPVMQASDNNKYMSMNIYGEYSSAGTPFLDCTNNLEPLDSNLVIYGHNMGIGRTSAFSTLTKYKGYSHWSNYPLIELNIKGKTDLWRIFAVLEFNVEDLSSYNYTTHNFLTQDDMQAFVDEAKERSSYDTGVEVTGEDHILTLSTCDRGTYGTKGRIVIMAVKE